ncbi:MAG: CDP-diacylglycerol--glycerol-3-phosphate 3-phosphatidyltransferase [Burkholderiales bacterium]|nr:CDP-diacylglycerol--glycerol-3-phosphate 3-phosphatidyltransferase [Opitutaceae bacterium]
MWNLPNILTLSRIPLMFVIVALMYVGWAGAATLAFWLFIAAAISDWLDGAIARKRGIVSNFGKFMDALTDKILVIGLMVAFVEQDSLPLPYVLVTLCREFLVSGMRMVAAAKGVVVPADGGGKTKTISQMIAIGCLLATPMLEDDIVGWTGWPLHEFAEWIHKIGLVGFIIGTFLAVWSGYRYLKRNWALFTE